MQRISRSFRGTTTPVAINNVNHQTNSAFYQGNIPAGSGQLTDPDCAGHPISGPPATNDNEFDGFTVPLIATAVVIPCSTYHIKLAIADVGDGIFDSAVFLRANSFDSGGDVKVDAVGSYPGSNVIYEGCDAGYFEFIRDGTDLSQPYTFNFTISSASTATEIIDYTPPLPGSITIPAGQTSVTWLITAINDMLPEGTESIILEFDVPCQCSNPSIELFIEDPPEIISNLGDQQMCSSQPVTLDPAVSGGLPGYSYNWSTGETTPTITVNPPPPGGTYYVTITDDCGNTQIDTANITIIQAPTANISGTASVCQGGVGNPGQLIINFTGTGPWEIVYTIDGVPQPPIITSDNPYTLEVTEAGVYELISVSSAGGACPGTAGGMSQVTETVISPTAVPTPITCNGESDGTIIVVPTGGTPNYTFNWDNPAASGPNPTDLPPGTYTVTVVDANGCEETTSATIDDVPVLQSSVSNVQDVTCANPTGNIDLTVSGGTPPYTFQWDNGGGTSQNPSGLGPGTYNVTITDANGCTETATATIADDTTPPTAAANGSGVITCDNPTLDLDGNGSSTGGEFTYQWTTPDGNIVSGSTTLNPTIDAAGTYTIEVTDTSNGCVETATVTITEDLAVPTANGSAPPITCTNPQVTINGAGSSTGPGFSYNWTTPDGNIVSGGNTLDPTVDQPGTYILTVTNDGNGCEATATVVVADDTAPPAAVANGGELTCVVMQLVLSGNGSAIGPGVTYNWTTNNGNIVSGGNTLNPVVDQAGTYTLTVTDASNGCTNTVDAVVNLNNLDPIADAGPNMELNCANVTIQLDGSGSSTGPDFVYNWTTIGGSILSGGNTANPNSWGTGHL